MQRFGPGKRNPLIKLYLVITGVILLSLLIFIPQRETLSQAVQSLWQANGLTLLFATAAMLCTFFAAGGAYYALVLHSIPYRRIVIAQLASGFATKLIPAGAGGLAVNIRFLMKHQHNLVQASSVAIINNVLGLAGHLLILIIAGTTYGISSFNLTNLDATGLILPVIVILTGAALISSVAIPIFKKRLIGIFIKVMTTLATYNRRPRRLLTGLAATSLVTILYVSCLYLTARALNVELTLLQTLTAFSIGVFGATITPTPGGVGGAEAALAAILLALGTSSSEALSVALAYRFITYWLPILPGFIFFHHATKEGYI